jgi:hypothetical protein
MMDVTASDRRNLKACGAQVMYTGCADEQAVLVVLEQLRQTPRPSMVTILVCVT